MRETKRKPKRFEDDEVLCIKVAENNFLNQCIVLEVIKLPNLTDLAVSGGISVKKGMKFHKLK